MKSEATIRDRIAEIEADERVHYDDANVEVNATLALHQVSQRRALRALRWVLADESDDQETE